MSLGVPGSEENKITEYRFRARDRQTMLQLTDRLVLAGYNVDAQQDTPRVSTHPWIVVAVPAGAVGGDDFAGVLQDLDAVVDE